MFEKVDDDSLELSGSDKPDIYSMLVTNSDNTEIWQFNKNLSKESDTNTGSMAAYLLISNKDSNNVIPSNSIIVFESSNAYVFSDELVSLLSHTISLVSSLFKTIRMGDLTTDYLSAIRLAYHAKKSSKICAEYAEIYGEGAFKFDLSRISWFALKNHFRIYSEQFCLDKELQEDQKEIYAFIDSLIKPIKSSKKECPEDIHKKKLEILNLNKNNIIDEFKKIKYDKQKKNFIDFLILCPSDVIWHCWLGAIRAVLESRNQYHNAGNGTSILSFEIAIPGYSALELLMVRATGEISQVIKLGQEDKLRKEKERYHKHVRYKILYAARIPQDGFAHECNGFGENDHKYGALVSDLVTGEDKSISTMLNYTSPSNITWDNQITFSALKKAVVHLFTDNLMPWYRSNDHLMIDSIIKDLQVEHKIFTGNDLIKYTSRCPDDIANIESWHDLFRKETKEVEEINEKSIDCLDSAIESFSKIFCKQQKKTDLFFKKIQLTSVRSLLTMENVFRFSVIHGDLNNNNLIWSTAHKRFFIIDFENIKSGFYGADQIFLFVSMICSLDTISNFKIFSKTDKNGTLWHSYINSTIQSIYVLQNFLKDFTNVTALNISDRRKIIDRYWNTDFTEVKSKDQLTVAFNDIGRINIIYKSLLLSTIKPIKKEDVKNDNGFKNFWTSAYRGFAVRQLAYALQNLNTVSKRNGHEGDFEELLKPAVNVVIHHLEKIKNKDHKGNSVEECSELEPAALSVAFALLLTMATFE